MRTFLHYLSTIISSLLSHVLLRIHTGKEDIFPLWFAVPFHLWIAWVMDFGAIGSRLFRRVKGELLERTPKIMGIYGLTTITGVASGNEARAYSQRNFVIVGKRREHRLRCSRLSYAYFRFSACCSAFHSANSRCPSSLSKNACISGSRNINRFIKRLSMRTLPIWSSIWAERKRKRTACSIIDSNHKKTAGSIASDAPPPFPVRASPADLHRHRLLAGRAALCGLIL